MFKEIFKTINEYEGGYSNDPLDHGGITKYGITSVDCTDVVNLTKDQAYFIYLEKYWTPLRCSEINSTRVRWKVFDIGVNLGKHKAATSLQYAVHVMEDGIIGQQTILSANRILYSGLGEREILYSLMKRQINQYVNIIHNDNTQVKFIRGWINRGLDLGENLI